jgi:L-threonylcarbamoyladenylate synthase
MAKDYLLSIPDDVNEKLIRRYWPGALTIILPCRIEKVPSLVRGGRNTLGVRLPDHDVACEIIKRVGVPVLGPSANFSGDKTPFSFSELDKQLVELVDFVVPGETKGLGRASTVVDCSTKPWRIIREGAVKIEEI